jgi:hypothetical protein
MNTERPIRSSTLYKTDLAGVALKPHESRIIATWLRGGYGGVSDESWQKLIYADNALGISGRSTLRRQSNLLRSRLSTVSTGLLKLIAEGSYRETIHACLAAAIKHSKLLGDFLDIVVRREYASGGRELDLYHWRTYLDACKLRDPNMGDWSPASTIRMRTTVMSILHEADLVDRGKPVIIKPPVYEKTVIDILERDQESWCLRCMRYDQ